MSTCRRHNFLSLASPRSSQRRHWWNMASKSTLAILSNEGVGRRTLEIIELIDPISKNTVGGNGAVILPKWTPLGSARHGMDFSTLEADGVQPFQDGLAAALGEAEGADTTSRRASPGSRMRYTRFDREKRHKSI